MFLNRANGKCQIIIATVLSVDSQGEIQGQEASCDHINMGSKF